MIHGQTETSYRSSITASIPSISASRQSSTA
jgi:hypothetical protein